MVGRNALERAYTRYVSELARCYQRSPELISYEEVSNWLYHLIKERELSASSDCAAQVCWSLGATDSTAIWELPLSYIPGDKSSTSIPISTALSPAER